MDDKAAQPSCAEDPSLKKAVVSEDPDPLACGDHLAPDVSPICDKVEGRDQQTNNRGVALTACLDGEKVCHPVVLVKVNGITCQALLDTGTSVSYASGYLLNLLKLIPTHSLTRRT